MAHRRYRDRFSDHGGSACHPFANHLFGIARHIKRATPTRKFSPIQHFFVYQASETARSIVNMLSQLKKRATPTRKFSPIQHFLVYQASKTAKSIVNMLSQLKKRATPTRKFSPIQHFLAYQASETARSIVNMLPTN